MRRYASIFEELCLERRCIVQFVNQGMCTKHKKDTGVENVVSDFLCCLTLGFLI